MPTQQQVQPGVYAPIPQQQAIFGATPFTQTMPIQQQVQPGVSAPIPQQQAITEPSNQLALIEPATRHSAAASSQLALPAPTQEEDERTAAQILDEVLFNQEQQNRVLTALPSSSRDYQMPGHKTEPPPLQAFPTNRYVVVVDPSLLAKNGDLTIKAAEYAINQYNEANPFNKIDLSNIDRTGLHHSSYLHQLMLKMKGKIRVIDGSDNSMVFNK